jgi:proteasome lid subunit RPN8/RPN11
MTQNPIISQFNKTNLDNILHQYAAAQLPNEACGYIIQEGSGDLAFFGCHNIHPNPRYGFTIDAKNAAQASRYGRIVALFHSHTALNLPTFSHKDAVACDAGSIPWVIIKLPEGDIQWLEPNQHLPLLGREFVWGSQDCYGLIRDVYSDIGIPLRDYPRGELFSADGQFSWNSVPGWNLYLDNFAKEGFYHLDRDEPMQKYDILLLNIGAPAGVANHGGIVMEPERNIFYQHLLDRLSEATIYGHAWRQMTVARLRHKDLSPRTN